MAVAYNNQKVVTDGLVLYLDAANSKSYPGSGGTWLDLSSKGNNGSLINSPTHTGDSFVFNGSNNYVLMPATTNIQGSITVTMLAKSNHSSSTGWNTYWSGVSNYNQFLLGANAVDGKMAFLVYSGTWYPTGYGGSIWGQTNVDPREYHYFVGTYNSNSGELSLYVDGVVEYSSNIGSRVLNQETSSFSIAKREVSGHFLNANIANVAIYNRAFSEEDVKQNLSVYRDRYGI